MGAAIAVVVVIAAGLGYVWTRRGRQRGIGAFRSGAVDSSMMYMHGAGDHHDHDHDDPGDAGDSGDSGGDGGGADGGGGGDGG